ncbi:MAG TPA: UPF0149 family protein [Gammaproteobacteria bacterium]|nr:UPF0149 family protein [Gammaproteobacteria bacterium]
MTHDNPKIQALLALGKPKKPRHWPDYVNLHGLSADDVADLLALVRDASIDELDSECPEVWGPLHAWRALGQIGSEQAIKALVAEFDRLREDDYGLEELPVVIGMIGPVAIPALEAYWQEPGKDEFAYVMAVDALCEIAKRHPANRDRVIGIYRDYMQTPSTTMGSLNGLLMAALLDLDAAEAIDGIRRLFSLDCVDPGCAGDLEDIEMELGLRDKRSTPKPTPVRLFGITGPADPETLDHDDEDLAADILDIIEQNLLMYGTDESILSASELDGFFAALACSPQIVRPSVWMPEIWGGRDAQPVWESLDDANHFNSAIMMLYNRIMQDFRIGEFEPLFLYGVENDDDRPIVGDWCEGLMRGLELWEELPHHQREQLEDDLTPIAFFASTPLDTLQTFDDNQIEALQLSIEPQVMKIYRQFRREFSPASSSTYVRTAPRVGRNAPCPCGSGKKYKKCCGLN